MSCGEPDFVKLAESFGVKGFLITERKQLQNEFKSALDFNGPALINIRVREERIATQWFPWKSNYKWWDTLIMRDNIFKFKLIMNQITLLIFIN